MGNILKKPMGTKPDIEALNENDENLKALTVLSDCQLCHSPITPSLKFTNINCPDHTTICKKCIVKHIHSKLEINAIEIACPASGCKALFDPVSCRDIVDRRPYRKWLDRLCYAAIAGRKKCYCPYTNCRALIVEECCGPRSYPTKTKCPNCQGWLCFFCGTGWHEGQPCNLSRRGELISLNDMLFFDKALGKKKKFTCCPKCRMYTELVPNTGFCIVRCRCKTAFCFHCEREVTRLSCTCKGFEEEIENYHGCIMFKMMFLILFFGGILVHWVLNKIEEDAYY